MSLEEKDNFKQMLSYQKIVHNVFEKVKVDNRILKAHTKEELIGEVVVVCAREFGQAIEEEHKKLRRAAQLNVDLTEKLKATHGESTTLLFRNLVLTNSLRSVIRDIDDLNLSSSEAKDTLEGA